MFAKRVIQYLGGNTVGHRDSRDSSRLGDDDVAVRSLTRQDEVVQDVLANLK